MDTPASNGIPRLVAETRKEKGLTLRQFADEFNADMPEDLHITYQSVSNWEHGVHLPDLQRMFFAWQVYPPEHWVGSMVREIIHMLTPSDLKVGKDG